MSLYLYNSRFMVVQQKGIWLYNKRVYGCTTKGYIVVQLKGIQSYD